MIGQTISHYRILEKIGAGGMGIVYKAEDTKLKRIVALKFLPPELTRDEEAKKRFLHEARAASALDHPNICNIFEIDETEDDQMFIAMGYYPGKNLKELIAQRPLPIQKAINITIQSIEGLIEAKNKGIIHRDIKSANIIITNSGQVKIMDFGLAKLQGATKLTKEGTALGTVAYMSPEQASGDKTDHRSDIWSLGVVLYEMLTGQLPFNEEYQQAVMYAIMNEDPEPVTGLRSGIPIPLENIILKMLAKDPARRYQNAEDVAVDLKSVDISSGPAPPGAVPSGLSSDTKKRSPLAKKSVWKPAFPILLAAIALILLTIWVIQKSNPNPTLSVKRFIISPEITREMTLSQHLDISPDGQYLVMRADKNGQGLLYLKKMDGFEVTPIEGSNGAQYPFFSPDNRWVAYFADGKLQKKLLSGGNPITICEVNPNIKGGVWCPDGNIILGSYREGLVRVSATSGEPESLTAPDGKASHRWPKILPDGKAVLFTIWPSQGHGSAFIKSANIAVIDLQSKKIKILIRGGTCPRYFPPGFLLYGMYPGNLMGVSFDPEEKKILSIPIPLIEDLSVFNTGWAGFGVSTEDTLFYKPTIQLSDGRLVWVDRSGREKPFEIESYGYQPRISPEGNRVIFSDNESKHYWIFNFVNRQKVKLNFDKTVGFVIFHPEGDRITYSINDPDPTRIVEKFLDQRINEKTLLEKDRYIICESWSPDGKYLAFYEFNPVTGRDIGILSLSTGTDEIILKTKDEETAPRFSPDGKWLAYESNKTGRFEVYVRSFSSGNITYQISNEGGIGPVWSPDGRELFFQSKSRLMAVAIETEPVFKPGFARKLFEGPYRENIYFPAFDIHPDGNRFLMTRFEEKKRVNHLKLVLNFSEELKRLIPGQKD
jgi:serine/threonine protein kinase